MSNEASRESNIQPNYLPLHDLVMQIDGPNGDACWQIYRDHADLFHAAPGSLHNHQTWPGGYADHVADAMNIAATLYDSLAATDRWLPFSKSDALLVMYLHDLEKPFKYAIDADGNLTDNPNIPDKASRAAKRLEVMEAYGIELNEQQANAIKYVEGIRDQDYTPNARLMGELAALCHCADVLSARLWYNYPAPEGQDQWGRAQRSNPAAAAFVLQSELGGD